MEAASASSTSSTSSPPPPLPEEENTSQNGVGVMTGMVTQTTEINKAVVWPPSKGASALASTAATRYMRQVEQSEDHKSNQYTLSRELFKPGKFNGEEDWNPSQGAWGLWRLQETRRLPSQRIWAKQDAIVS